MKIFLLLATGSLLATNPLHANPPPAAGPAQAADTVAISLDDYDLTRPEDRAALDARLVAASRGVCRALPFIGPMDWIARARCDREVLAQARATVALAIAAAERREQLAQNAAAD